MYFQKMQILGVFRPFLQRSLLYLGGTVNETILEVTSTVLRLKSIRRKKKNGLGWICIQKKLLSPISLTDFTVKITHNRSK